LGTNFEISIKDTVGLISNLMNSSSEIETSIERNRPAKSEVERLWADNSKARKVLNWQPKYYDLKGLSEGLKKTVDWFTNSDNLARYKSDRYNK
jgi:dTDP-glucose 4,6-dehydratase